MDKLSEKEIQNILLRIGDKRMIDEFDIGCHNSFDQGEARCPYMEGSVCARGALLTSTMIGAHPNDCPLYHA